jgi:hypothetical protein
MRVCGGAVAAESKRWLERKGLRLNETKTRVVDFENEIFEFLGFRLARRKARSGRSYPHCEPSPKSCGRLREAIRDETTRSTLWKAPEEVLARVNRRVGDGSDTSITPIAHGCSTICSGNSGSA